MENPTFRTRLGSAYIAAALFLAPASHAIPLYYTFEGNVIYSTSSSRPLGTPVHFTFLVDRDRDGLVVDGDGNTTVERDVVAYEMHIDHFYASYVGGSALASDNPATPIKASWFSGVEQTVYGERYSALHGSNFDPSGRDLITIWSYDLDFRDWHVGMNLLGNDMVVSTHDEPATIFSSALTLTSISDTGPVAAVPEPSTLSFMGLGLLGLGVALRKRRKR